MKKFRNLLLPLFAILLVSSTNADTIEYKNLKPDSQHPRVSQVIMHILSRSHYHSRTVNDSLSSDMFNQYIRTLDFNRSFFLASDLQEFETYRYRLDDALKSGDLSIAFKIYNLFQERFDERLQYIKKRLQSEFDFTIDEYYEADRSEAAWAETPAQLDSIWRKRLKNDALRMILAKKEWKDISETLLKRYTRMEKNIIQSESEDVFQW